MDRATYERYRLFPADRLGWAVSGFVSVTSAKVPDSLYAHIHMADSGECPFFEADHLCGIQKAYGQELLSSSCSSYPRALNKVDGVLEGSLSLSCPEAARNVLLEPDFLERESELAAGGFRTDNFFWLGNDATSPVKKPFGAFHAVRTAMIELVRDRSRPIWLRLLRVGALCERLEGSGDALAAIADFREADQDRELLHLKEEPELRLALTMYWSDERLRDASVDRRFQDTYWSFIEGMASGPGSDLDGLIAARKTYYEPFMAMHPHVLENFLVNYFYQRLFPFGRSGGVALRERGLFEEFLLLASQFGWMETLLIGVAGRWREGFGAEHLVATVQTFHRAVEHYPAVAEGMLALLHDRGMESLAGAAVMLKP